ncbi:MAG TPA: glycosyltransferase family 4 protein [Thermoleophilaceae bacterium]|nr:glycosyltransferase family 4 protein [Thermoleophilaceae bacterium]
MRIGLYDPHLATLGGGERYFLGLLEEAIAVPGASVVLFSPERPDSGAWRRLGFSIEESAFSWEAGMDAEVTAASADLDLLVAMVNEVPPLSHARRSAAMIQFPHRSHTGPRGRVLRALGVSRAAAALGSYELFLVNSEFTRAHVRERLGVEARVVPPPVEAARTTAVKEPVVLSVGRFFSDWHSKNQHVLVDAFAGLEAPGWRLVLAGGADDPAYVERVRRAAVGLPVELRLDVRRDELLDLYARASLFWHAAGFGQDARRHPERLEHFGIATVEAMAHGALPLVFPEGGSAELVEDGVTGRWWRSPEELVVRTRELIGDEDQRERLSAAARTASERYSEDRFRTTIRALLLDH